MSETTYRIILRPRYAGEQYRVLDTVIGVEAASEAVGRVDAQYGRGSVFYREVGNAVPALPPVSWCGLPRS
jgi:hypothetical protein